MTRRVTLRPGVAVRYKSPTPSWWIVVSTTRYPVDGITGEERPDLQELPDGLRLLVFDENEEPHHGWTTVSTCTDDGYFLEHYEVFG